MVYSILYSSVFLGEGNYGEVFKARNVQTGELAAAKIMEAVVDKEEDIKAELNVFEHHSHHPNIVDFFGAFVKKDTIADDQLWIVMEVGAAGMELPRWPMGSVPTVIALS